MEAIVPEALEAYARDHSLQPEPLLQELETYTRTHCDLPQMLVGPLEGALLRLLVRLSGARRVLEIGGFTGYSALTMAAALPEEGELITCEIDPGHAAIARSFFDRSPHGGKIRLQTGPALETVRALAETPQFHLVFIDADKENYINYYEAVLPRLHPGGLIVADNTLWSGAVLNPEKETDKAIAAFNEHVQKDPQVENVLLTVRDGMMLAWKK